MALLQREAAATTGQNSTSNAPIIVALTSLSEDEKVRLRHKFDIVYWLAVEKISFRKFPSLCDLETRHGVNIGTTYTTETAAKSFTGYIAQAQRNELAVNLQKAKFFSLLLDGSTDAGNIDNELLLVVWFDKDGVGEKVYTRTSYSCISRPVTATALGIFDVVQAAVQKLGFPAISGEQCTKLVGIGTDGAAANIAGAGLKGLVEKKLPWIFWMWCMAHRLELAVKDAFKKTSVDLVDEMLLRLYLLYENSPKKCRQLEDVVVELKECLSIEDGGTRPIRASGSRWICHKWNAMKCVLSKYGAYTSHLAALSEDPTVKSADKAKLKGYYRQWINGKYLLGCALFVDLLTPCTILSKVLQSDDLDILPVLTSLLRSVKEVDKLSSTHLDRWPTYAATLLKCTNDNGAISYQSQELVQFEAAKTYFTSTYKDYCSKVSDCIKSRLAWSDLQFFRDIIFVLATQGWQKLLDESDPLEAVDRLVEHFLIPLRKANVCTEEIHGEFESALQYACQYISLSTIEYHAVWWHLFHAPVASEWLNALAMVELLFSLPASNSVVERVFSQVSVIKTKKRCSLSNESLDDLLTITSAHVPLKDFCPDNAINLWWKEKVRRPNQKPRRPYKKQKRISTSSSAATASTTETIELLSSTSESDSGSSSDESNLLDDWDDWIDNQSD